MTPVRRNAAEARPRAVTQRERILDAAQKCFVDKGFRGASMALIADTAGVSVGLAYRYFKGKNAIMLAIIERELEAKRQRVDRICAQRDFLGAIVESFRAWQVGSPEAMNPALFVEMSAEATRSPEIAAALRAADGQVLADFERWLVKDRRAGGLGLDRDEARTRSLLVQCLIDGLVVRATRDPGLDPGEVRQALQPVFSLLGLLPATAAEDQHGHSLDR